MVNEDEQYERWKTIIAGDDDEHRLVHGYYLTMQRRTDSTSTWRDNLQNEVRFFENDAIWKHLPNHLKKCIGTTELRKKLSLELSRLIKNRYVCPRHNSLIIEFRRS